MRRNNIRLSQKSFSLKTYCFDIPMMQIIGKNAIHFYVVDTPLSVHIHVRLVPCFCSRMACILRKHSKMKKEGKGSGIRESE